MSYGTPTERAAWARYNAATTRRRRHYRTTAAAIVATTVVVAAVQLAILGTPMVWALVPLPIVPCVVYLAAVVAPERRAARQWREAVDA